MFAATTTPTQTDRAHSRKRRRRKMDEGEKREKEERKGEKEGRGKHVLWMKEGDAAPSSSTSAKLLRQDCREQAMRVACAWLQASSGLE